MNLRCKDCKVTFDSPYNKDCPFCGSDAFVVELLHENKEPDYWMIRGEIWSDDIAFLEAHNGTSSEVQAAMDEWENNAVPLYKSPDTTDKLLLEKLQEIRVEELKDFNSKILQAELKNQKLQKEIDAAKKYIEESYKADKEDNKLLDLIIEAVAKLKSDNETLKKALTEISKTKDFYRSGRDHWEEFSQDALKAQKALAAIGWGGCPVGAVGKNGLTKEEIEGSGDE